MWNGVPRGLIAREWQILQVFKVGDQVKRRGGGDEIGEVVNVFPDFVVVCIQGDFMPTPPNEWMLEEVIPSPLGLAEELKTGNVFIFSAKMGKRSK